VPEYRLYCLDEKRRILDRHDFEAADDDEALAIASKREHPHLACEVGTGAVDRHATGRNLATAGPLHRNGAVA